MYKLYYDATCPICNNFVKLIKSKVDLSKLQFLPITTNDSNFKLELPSGKVVSGQEALNELANAFPIILNYFWMLPNVFKKPALNVVYKAGAVIRKVIKKVTGCNCGNKK